MNEVIDKVYTWGHNVMLMLPNFGLALVVVAIAWLVAIGLGRTAVRLMSRVSGNKTLNDLVGTLTRFAVAVAGLIIALNVLNLDKAVTTFLAGAGIAGLAIGFAFQDLSANFISGIAMAVRRPMQIGDLVETNDLLGTILKVELRSTLLQTLDGKTILIPNRKIYEEPLINHSGMGRRRVDLAVGVSYGDDLEKVQRVAMDAVEKIEPRLDRPVELFYQGFGSSSIDFEVRFWVGFRKQTDYLKAQSDAVMAIKKAFDQNDITIPFPIRTLDFAKVGGEQLHDSLARWSERKAS